MRDVRGKPVPPDKDVKVRGQKDTEKEESAGKRMDPAAHLKDCRDCMKAVTSHMGNAKPADGFKSEQYRKHN